MYAAFALQARVQAFVDAAGANSMRWFRQEISGQNREGPKETAAAAPFPTRPATSFGDNQDITFPKLNEIFTFSPPARSISSAPPSRPSSVAQIDGDPRQG